MSNSQSICPETRKFCRLHAGSIENENIWRSAALRDWVYHPKIMNLAATSLVAVAWGLLAGRQ